MNPKSLVIQTLWVGTMIACGYAAVGASLDFDTRVHPNNAEFVPSPFKAFSYLVDAQNAMVRGDYERATDLARAHLLRSPLPAEGLTAFALATGNLQTTDGDLLSSRALALSAQRGWREPIAQLALLTALINERNWLGASQRLDALFRTGNGELLPEGALEAIAADPVGREELARRLATPRSWTDQFLRVGSERLPGDQFTAIIARSSQLGASWNCEAVGRTTISLLDRGEGRAARSLWQAACPQELDQGTSNLAFRETELTADPQPFSWFYPSEPGISRHLQRDVDRISLAFSNSDQLRRTIAQRHFDFAPGRANIAVDIGPQAAAANGAIWMDVICTGEPVRILRPLAPVNSGIVQFEVPADGSCEVQRVRLQAAPTGSRTVEVSISG